MHSTMPGPVAAVTVILAVWIALVAFVCGPWLVALIAYGAAIGYLGAAALVALVATVVAIIRGWRWAPYAALLFPLCATVFTFAALAHDGRLSLPVLVGGGSAVLLAVAASALHLRGSRLHFAD